MKKILSKLLMFMMVFSMLFSAEVAMQQKTVNAEPTYDYVWCVERGEGDERAGYMMLLVDSGELTHEDLYSQCINNWYSVAKIERMINRGYMLDYVQQLKDGGWIPNDFVRTPIEPTSGSSNSNTQTTPLVHAQKQVLLHIHALPVQIPTQKNFH